MAKTAERCGICGRNLPEGVKDDPSGCRESCRSDYARSLEPRLVRDFARAIGGAR